MPPSPHTIPFPVPRPPVHNKHHGGPPFVTPKGQSAHQKGPSAQLAKSKEKHPAPRVPPALPPRSYDVQLTRILPQCLSDVSTVQPDDTHEYMSQWLRKAGENQVHVEDKRQFLQSITNTNQSMQVYQEERKKTMKSVRSKAAELKEMMGEIANEQKRRRPKKDTSMDAVMVRFRRRRQEVWGNLAKEMIAKGEAKLPGVRILPNPFRKTPEAPIEDTPIEKVTEEQEKAVQGADGADEDSKVEEVSWHHPLEEIMGEGEEEIKPGWDFVLDWDEQGRPFRLWFKKELDDYECPEEPEEEPKEEQKEEPKEEPQKGAKRKGKKANIKKKQTSPSKDSVKIGSKPTSIPGLNKQGKTTPTTDSKVTFSDVKVHDSKVQFSDVPDAILKQSSTIVVPNDRISLPKIQPSSSMQLSRRSTFVSIAPISSTMLVELDLPDNDDGFTETPKISLLKMSIDKSNKQSLQSNLLTDEEYRRISTKSGKLSMQSQTDLMGKLSIGHDEGVLTNQRHKVSIQNQIDLGKTFQAKLNIARVEGFLTNEKGRLVDMLQRLVDNKGRLINDDGHLISEDGDLINEQGKRTDEKGNLIDEDGRRLDEVGRLVDTYGRLVDEAGKLVDASGRLIDETGRLIDHQQKLIDTYGRHIDQKGRLIDSKGRIINENGRLVDKKGRLVNERGKLINTEGIVINENGFVIDDRGQTINEFGQLVDEAGRLVNEKGVLVETDDEGRLVGTMGASNRNSIADGTHVIQRTDGFLVDPKGRLVNAEGQFINEAGHIVNFEGKLVDERGRRVNEDERLIDYKGRLIDEFGRLVNIDGGLVDFKGRLIDEQGKLINADGKRIDDKGRFIDGTGRLIDEKGRYIDVNKRLIDKAGRLIDETGRYIDVKGRLIDSFGRPIDHKGRLLDKHGRLIDETGRFIDAKGNFVDAKGNLVDDNGRLVDEFGRYVTDKGALIDKYGRLIDEAGKLINAMGQHVTRYGTVVETPEIKEARKRSLEEEEEARKKPFEEQARRNTLKEQAKRNSLKEQARRNSLKEQSRRNSLKEQPEESVEGGKEKQVNNEMAIMVNNGLGDDEEDEYETESEEEEKPPSVKKKSYHISHALQSYMRSGPKTIEGKEENKVMDSKGNLVTEDMASKALRIRMLMKSVKSIRNPNHIVDLYGEGLNKRFEVANAGNVEPNKPFVDATNKLMFNHADLGILGAPASSDGNTVTPGRKATIAPPSMLRDDVEDQTYEFHCDAAYDPESYVVCDPDADEYTPRPVDVIGKGPAQVVEDFQQMNYEEFKFVRQQPKMPYFVDRPKEKEKISSQAGSQKSSLKDESLKILKMQGTIGQLEGNERKRSSDRKGSSDRKESTSSEMRRSSKKKESIKEEEVSDKKESNETRIGIERRESIENKERLKRLSIESNNDTDDANKNNNLRTSKHINVRDTLITSRGIHVLGNMW